MIESKDVLADPNWLPHGYDAANRRVAFALIPPATREQLTFLADFKPNGEQEICWIPADQVAAEKPAAAQVHFLFHSAFCRSTLLVQALGAFGGFAGLSEPAILNTLQNASADATSRSLIGPICALLGRPVAGESTVIVKPSNFPNGLIPAFLDQAPGAKGLILFGGLPEFLRSVAKKGLAGRIWARRQLAHNRQVMPLDLGLDERAYYELTDLQCAALAWLLQIRQFDELLKSRPDTLRSLNSDYFIANKADTLAACMRWYCCEADSDQARGIAEGPLFASHAKLGGDYAAIQAQQTEASDSQVTEDEIAQIEQWIQVIMQQMGLSLPLPQPLEIEVA